MLDRTPQGAVRNGELTMTPLTSEGALNVRRLNEFAFRGVMSMFDKDTRLFCYRLKRNGAGFAQEGVSPRYTVMTLLGLHRLETAGVPSPVGIQETFEILLKDSRWINNIGDLGLVLWLCATIQPDRLDKIVEQFGVRQALHQASTGNTMELAWFLSGLAHHALAEGGCRRSLNDEAMEAYRLLITNQGEQGIFSHSARKKSIAGVLRGRVGSFADQIYPVYALAKASLVFPLEKASDRALDCALTLCQMQGPQGQWWWHYDSSTGRVVGRYPVYSVHQHGMAPMGLLALGEVLQSDFGPWIFKGLEWIKGDNELDYDMRDNSANLVWRCIYQGDYERYLRTALALITHREDGPAHEGLGIRYECRPYEFGWLLYAFGDHGL